MKIIDMFLTPSKYTRQQTPINVTKIAIHYTANPMSSALGNRNYFESLSKLKNRKASSHYIIGLQGEIIRCIPENEQSIATNSANPYSISIECCHPDSSGKFNELTYNSLVELCIDICKRHKLNPLNDIIRHFDVTKKLCPKWFVENYNEWIKFKDIINNKLYNIDKTNDLNKSIQDNIITFEDALHTISKNTNISYDYWLKRKDIDKYFVSFIIKLSKLKFKNIDLHYNNTFNNYNDSLKIICNKCNLDYNYWITKQNIDKNFSVLVIKIAKYI